MSTDKKTIEPSAADLAVELKEIDEHLDAEVAALQLWDEKNAAGEPVDPNEKPKRRNLIEVLRDRRTNAAARKTRAERKERLERLAELRAEIEAQEAQDAEETGALVEAALDAMRPVLARCGARSERLAGYHASLSQLDVPPHSSNASEPDPEHGGMGFTGSKLAVGRLRLGSMDGAALLERMVRALVLEAGGAPDAVTALAGLKADVALLAEEVGSSEGLRYFVNRSGAVHRLGDEGIARADLSNSREISEAEANEIEWARNQNQVTRG